MTQDRLALVAAEPPIRLAAGLLEQRRQKRTSASSLPVDFADTFAVAPGPRRAFALSVSRYPHPGRAAAVRFPLGQDGVGGIDVGSGVAQVFGRHSLPRGVVGGQEGVGAFHELHGPLDRAHLGVAAVGTAVPVRRMRVEPCLVELDGGEQQFVHLMADQLAGVGHLVVDGRKLHYAVSSSRVYVSMQIWHFEAEQREKHGGDNFV